jgi:hypothetical protein
MARRRENVRVLERGAIELFERPRIDAPDDIQRLLIVMLPERAPLGRLIVVGRKRIPEVGRFWGFVDLVLAPADLRAALGAQVYVTKTRGVRHLPAAVQTACGRYELTHHHEHTHLSWDGGDFIVTVANPDPAAWGLIEPPDLQLELFDEPEVHVTVPTPFPPELQARFEGRRYLQLDTPEWLDHPGAELIFIRPR